MALVLLLSACDPGSELFFMVKNNSDSVITVRYCPLGTDSNSVVAFLHPGAEQIIYKEDWTGFVSWWETQDSLNLWGFSMKGTPFADTVNLRSRKNWIYRKEDDTEAWFTLTVE